MFLPRSAAVSILDFSLIANHYHLYLFANIENSVPIFIQKLNRGFSGYFNLKYGRKGHLFEGPYKSVATETENQGVAISRYVSVINPLDLYQPNWRKDGLRDWQKALSFLKSFSFSSFPDKIGERRSSILATQSILRQYSFMGCSEKEVREFTERFLKEKDQSVKYFYE